VALDRTVRVLKVTGFAERRGAAESARALVEDLTPAPEPKPKPAAAAAGLRSAGAGRPTKRERRAIAHFKGEDEL
jgi:ribosome-associated heat shock protein Hsp15